MKWSLIIRRRVGVPFLAPSKKVFASLPLFARDAKNGVPNLMFVVGVSQNLNGPATKKR